MICIIQGLFEVVAHWKQSKYVFEKQILPFLIKTVIGSKLLTTNVSKTKINIIVRTYNTTETINVHHSWKETKLAEQNNPVVLPCTLSHYVPPSPTYHILYTRKAIKKFYYLPQLIQCFRKLGKPTRTLKLPSTCDNWGFGLWPTD